MATSFRRLGHLRYDLVEVGEKHTQVRALAHGVTIFDGTEMEIKVEISLETPVAITIAAVPHITGDFDQGKEWGILRSTMVFNFSLNMQIFLQKVKTRKNHQE